MDTIIGQDQAISLLQRSLDLQRVHHAWIFSGPLGVGKYTAAVGFAKHLLQIDPSSPTAHPDLHIIRKEDVVWSENPALQRKKQTNIPVDLLRERMIGGKTSDDRNHDAVAYKTPILGKNKVFIIDEAELLDEQAQNVLLKTLEEPPAGTTIILVTSRDDTLLPTILSRCQHVCFAPLNDESMRLWADRSSIDISNADLSWLIGFSSGSPGLVCRAIEACVPQLVCTVSDFLYKRGGGDYTRASTVIVDFVENYVDKRLKENNNASKEALNRIAVELVLMVFGSAASTMIRGGNTEEGIVAAGIITDLESQLTTNISIKVLLESLAARWAHLSVGDSVFV